MQSFGRSRGNPPEQWQRVGIPSVEVQVQQSAERLIERIMTRYAAGLLKALRPTRHQAGGFVAQGCVASGFGHASHAAQPLAEHAFRGGAAPAVQMLARRGQTGLHPKAVHQIVVWQGKVKIAGSLVLVAETAGQKPDARIVESLQAYAGGRRLPSVGRRRSQRNRHHGLQKAASWQVVSRQRYLRGELARRRLAHRAS